MQKLTALTLATAIAASAFAVQAADDDTVKARQEAMKTIGASTKTLGGIAKGSAAYDEAVVKAAASAIAGAAAEVPALFEADVTNADSEAAPAIWANYADFSKKADELRVAAENLANADEFDFGPAFGAVGGTCKSCHESYRIKK